MCTRPSTANQLGFIYRCRRYTTRRTATRQSDGDSTSAQPCFGAVSPLRNTFFEGVRMPILKVLQLMHAWILRLPVSAQLRGRCVQQDCRGFLQFFPGVPNKSRAVLWSYMYAFIEPGTIILSDSAPQYKGCEQLGFAEHKAVNHSVRDSGRFVSTTDQSCHTQNIETLHRHLKIVTKYLEKRHSICHNQKSQCDIGDGPRHFDEFTYLEERIIIECVSITDDELHASSVRSAFTPEAMLKQTKCFKKLCTGNSICK